MVTIMALTVCGAMAVSAAQPVSAAPAHAVLSVGQNYLWSGSAFNVRQTKLMSVKGAPTITMSSTGTKLVTKIAAKNGSGGFPVAYLGVRFNIAGVTTAAQWNKIKTKPVCISAYVSYNVTSHSNVTTRANTIALNGGAASTADPQDLLLSRCGATTVWQTKDGTLSNSGAVTSITTTLEKLGTTVPGECDMIVWCGSYAQTNAGAHYAQLSAQANVYAFVLVWL